MLNMNAKHSGLRQKGTRESINKHSTKAAHVLAAQILRWVLGDSNGSTMRHRKEKKPSTCTTHTLHARGTQLFESAGSQICSCELVMRALAPWKACMGCIVCMQCAFC